VADRYWFGFPFAVPNLPIPLGAQAAGELISSAEDMAHYLSAHLNEGRYGNTHILSGAGINELHRRAFRTPRASKTRMEDATHE
jgi:CubicO group peptidase (beta-lactamase class C family)